MVIVKVLVQLLIDSQGEGLFIILDVHVVETIEVGQNPRVGLVLDQLLSSTVNQANMGIGPDHNLEQK